MGERARRAYRARTTPSQRLDDGIRLADEFIEARLAELELPADLTLEERVRRQFKHLRSLGS